MTQDESLTRIGVSLPGKMVGEFDEILKYRGYSSRSEGIRDAIRTYNLNHQWLADSTRARKGAITLVYDFRKSDLLLSISEIRHRYPDLIRTSVQTCVSRTRRVEVLLIQGNGTDLKGLFDLLQSMKGIESVRITTTPVTEETENLPISPVPDDRRLPVGSV